MGFYLKSVIVRPHQPNRLSNPHIPPRDPTIKSTLIDLTRFYNLGLTNALLSGAAGDNLSALLPGTPNFGGIQFDVRGVAHLSSKTLTKEHWRDFSTRDNQHYRQPKG
jgi:hypothetical protein